MTDETSVPSMPEAVPPHLAEAEPPASVADLAPFDAEAAERQPEAALATRADALPHHSPLDYLEPRAARRPRRRGRRPPPKRPPPARAAAPADPRPPRGGAGPPAEREAAPSRPPERMRRRAARLKG